nr:tRNA isopentenyltransferase [Tanacetum cinerariifolium]
DFTAQDFCYYALAVIKRIVRSGKLPVIVGGSNSFIEALVEDPVFGFRSKYEFCFLWTDVSSPVLYSYVGRRVDQMVDAGLIDEVRDIYEPMADYTRGIRKSIGVPELHEYLQWETKVDHETAENLLNVAISDIKSNTCKLTDSQLSKIHRLRKELRWPIHRVDATNVFLRRGLDIVTNKITESEMKGVPHHLLGEIQLEVNFTAQDFCFHALAIIRKVVRSDTMSQLEFGEKWCKWVEACLNPAMLSVLVNGSSTNEFLMERGVRQGVKIGHDDISVSHLQHADDTLVFGDWSLPNAKNLMRIFKCVQNVPGFKIIYLKTKIYGVGIKNDEIERLANRIGVSPGFLPFVYLGLPTNVGAIGARKSSLYYFLLFRAPVHVNKKLESMRQNFFWGGNDEKKKLAWVKWDQVISKSSVGGLDVGSLKACNLALLEKWWWRFRVEDDRLWVKLIKNIYGEYGWLGEEGVYGRSSGGKWSDIIKAGNDIEKT